MAIHYAKIYINYFYISSYTILLLILNLLVWDNISDGDLTYQFSLIISIPSFLIISLLIYLGHLKTWIDDDFIHEKGQFRHQRHRINDIIWCGKVAKPQFHIFGLKITKRAVDIILTSGNRYRLNTKEPERFISIVEKISGKDLSYDYDELYNRYPRGTIDIIEKREVLCSNCKSYSTVRITKDDPKTLICPNCNIKGKCRL